tara:strand:- start:281 stop:403 length:123 start_codon:yes stop_codon:yes gene_type:complete
MPKVDGKSFPYTAAGKAKAKRHAAKTGKKMTATKKKKSGY